MNNNIREFIKSAVSDLIEKTSSDKKVEKLAKTHSAKIHFMPIRYRIFGGLLHSMNIQFGNFIERLLHKIVENEQSLNINKFSGSNRSLPFTQRSNDLVDNYITNCQNDNFNDNELLDNFKTLIDNCLDIEKSNATKEISIRYDIDVLFSNQSNETFYLEVKYNDDHDTGKYADINRKFIKSYIGVSNILKIYDRTKFKPILCYLTQKKLKGNIYLPESENIYRGDKLFTEFFTVNYQELDSLMENIGNNEDIIKLFDDLHNEIRFNLHL